PRRPRTSASLGRVVALDVGSVASRGSPRRSGSERLLPCGRHAVQPWILQRRTIADPLRWRACPVPRERVDAPGVLRPHSAEVGPRSIGILELKPGSLQASSRLVELFAFHAHFRIPCQAKVEEEILDAVSTNRA